MAAYQGPPIKETVTRPFDRWPKPEESSGALAAGSSKFTALYAGNRWDINHKMEAETLIMDIWVDPSTVGARYTSIVQMDLNNIQVYWDQFCRGRVCIYRCLEVDHASRVYQQLVPAEVWTFTHDLGTDALVLDCWVEGVKVDPVSISITSNAVTCTFDAPCKGIICLLLTDPAINPELRIMWNQILGVPPKFPPTEHSHPDAGEVELANNALQLGGIPATQYALKILIGVTICELDENGQIPYHRLPDQGKLMVSTSNPEEKLAMIVREVEVDNVMPSPLYITLNETENKATLRMHPVVKMVKFAGEVEEHPAYKDTIEASAEFGMRFIAGENVRIKVVDRHTAEFNVPSMACEVFKCPIDPWPTNPFDEFIDNKWYITHKVFDVPGAALLELYERLEPGVEQPNNTLHIKDEYVIDEVFLPQGDEKIMGLTDDLFHSEPRFSSSHFWWEEELSDNFTFQEWYELCGLYWNAMSNTYIMVDTLMNDYRFHSFDPNTEAISFVRAVPIAEFSPIIDVAAGYVFAVFPSPDGKILLRQTFLLDIPSHTWTDICVFDDSVYPLPDFQGDNMMKYDGRYFYLYRQMDLSIKVWDTLNPNDPPIFTYTLTQPLTQFIVWPDRHISYAYGMFPVNPAQTSFYTTDKPVTDPTAVFVYSGIELMAGVGKWIAMTHDLEGGISIRDDGKWVWAKKTFMDPTNIYHLGKASYWLRPTHGLHIPLNIAYAYGFKSQLVDIPPGFSIRVAFSLLPFSNYPTKLSIWTGTEFLSYPIAEFPDMAQDISVFETIKLYGGQTLYYMYWVEQTSEYNEGKVSQTFDYIEMEAGMFAPVVYNDHTESDGTVDIKVPIGGCVLDNLTGRTLLEPTLVAFGGKI